MQPNGINTNVNKSTEGAQHTPEAWTFLKGKINEGSTTTLRRSNGCDGGMFTPVL